MLRIDADGIERVERRLEGFLTASYGDGRHERRPSRQRTSSHPKLCRAQPRAQGTAILWIVHVLAGLDARCANPLALPGIPGDGVLYGTAPFYRDVRKLAPGTRLHHRNGTTVGRNSATGA